MQEEGSLPYLPFISRNVIRGQVGVQEFGNLAWLSCSDQLCTGYTRTVAENSPGSSTEPALGQMKQWAAPLWELRWIRPANTLSTRKNMLHANVQMLL